MEILSLMISKSKLENVSEDERNFFLLIGHVTNEFNILSKILMFTQNYKSENFPISRAQIAQAFVIAKILIGKVHECWLILGKSFFGKRLSLKFEPLLDQQGSNALKKLKQYFGRDNFINKIRNTFSFHYSPDEIAKGYDLIDSKQEKEMVIFLAEQNLNSLFHLSEVVANYAMLGIVDQEDVIKAIERFYKETVYVIKLFNVFFMNCMSIIINEYFSNQDKKVILDKIDIGEVPSYKEANIPFYVKSD